MREKNTGSTPFVNYVDQAIHVSRSEITEYEQTFINSARQRFETWIDRNEQATIAALPSFPKEGQAAQSKQLILLRELAQQYQKIGSNEEITLGNTSFNAEYHRYSADVKGCVLLPTTSQFRPAHKRWQIEGLLAQMRGINNVGHALNLPLSELPLLFEIHLPQDFIIDNYKVGTNWGWVQDLGAVTTISSAGVDGLPSRSEGHYEHEAWHKLIHMMFPELYNNVLRPKPHLEESMAIMTELIMPNGNEDLYQNYSNPSYPTFKNGMLQSYLAQLTPESLIKPLSFKDLDGGQRFAHGLYVDRLPLAMFMKTMIQGGLLTGQNETENLQIADQLMNRLALGLKFMENYKFRQYISESQNKSSLTHISSVLDTMQTANEFTEDQFLKNILSLNIQDPAKVTNEVEKLYKKFCALSTFTLMMHHTENVSFSPDLMAIDFDSAVLDTVRKQAVKLDSHCKKNQDYFNPKFQAIQQLHRNY